VTAVATDDLIAPAGLVAWSVEVDDPGDLLSWLPSGQAFAFLRGGDGIVGWGEAARLATTVPRPGEDLTEQVERLLASMTSRDDVGVPGTGPVAIVSLAFDPEAAGSVVVVPNVVLGRRDGRAWLTLVTPPGAVQVPQLRRRPAEAPAPLRAHVEAAVPSEEQWAERVARAVEAMRAGDLDKVVDDVVATIAGGPPVALSMTKRELDSSVLSTLAQALEAEAMGQTITVTTEDTQEAIAAFVQKRDPVFKGR